MFLDWRYPIEHIGELLSGAWMTAQISVICFIASLLLGTLCSIVRFSKKPKILYVFVSAFVEIMRNTPLLVQLFFVFSEFLRLEFLFHHGQRVYWFCPLTVQLIIARL